MNQSPQPPLGATPEPSAALVAIGERLRTQDNRITQNPMFCVQQKRRVTGLHRDYSDKTVWILDGEKVEPETEGAREYGIQDHWETVMVAFTEVGCQEYLRLNGHNLREPRIYVESFNRCPEMIAIREWLMSPQLTELATARAALAQEVEDRKRLDWLEKTLIHSKWDDAIPAIRPRHPTEFYPIAKYIGEDQWNIREAIDAAISAATPATTGKDSL